MAQTIDLNNIVKDIVEYEAGKGGLSNIVPGNLKHIEPFTDDDNVALSNNNIVLNGYKVRVVTDKENMQLYFPRYYSQISSDIVDDEDRISINDSDEVFDAKVSALIDELCASISAFNAMREELQISSNLSNDTTIVGTGISKRNTDDGGEEGDDLIHGLSPDAEDKLNEERDDANRVENDYWGYTSSEIGRAVKLSGEIWYDDKKFSFDEFNKDDPDMEYLFCMVLGIFGQVAAGYDFKYANGNFFKICNEPSLAKLENAKKLKNTIKDIVKTAKSSFTAVKDLYDYVHDYVKGHDKDELCDIKIEKIKKYSNVIDPICSLLNELKDNNTFDDLDPNRLYRRPKDGWDIDFLLMKGAEMTVELFSCYALTEIYGYVDEMLREHAGLKHDFVPINVIFRAKGRETRYHKQDRYLSESEIFDDMFDEFKSYVKKNADGWLYDGSNPSADDFFAGVTDDSLESLDDRINDIVEIQKMYDSYNHDGNNDYPKRVDGEKAITLDDILWITPTYCDTWRTRRFCDWVEFGPNHSTIDLARDWVVSPLLPKEAYVINRTGDVDFILDETESSDTSATYGHNITQCLSVKLSSFNTYPTDWSGLGNWHYDVVMDRMDRTTIKFNGIDEEIELSGEMSPEMVVSCRVNGASLSCRYKSDSGDDKWFTIRKDDNGRYMMQINRYWKAKEICELEEPKSGHYATNLSCSLSGLVETRTCDKCGKTYKYCTLHGVEEEHDCTPGDDDPPGTTEVTIIEVETHDLGDDEDIEGHYYCYNENCSNHDAHMETGSWLPVVWDETHGD